MELRQTILSWQGDVSGSPVTRHIYGLFGHHNHSALRLDSSLITSWSVIRECTRRVTGHHEVNSFFTDGAELP